MSGDATVSGRAFVTMRSGAPVVCHGDDMRLIAVTPYTRQRMARAFKEGSGYASRIAIETQLDDHHLDPFQRHASCDREGKFRFEQIAAGQYYALAKIYWSQRWGWYGGGVMQTINVGMAEQTELALTHALSGND